MTVSICFLALLLSQPTQEATLEAIREAFKAREDAYTSMAYDATYQSHIPDMAFFQSLTEKRVSPFDDELHVITQGGKFSAKRYDKTKESSSLTAYNGTELRRHEPEKSFGEIAPPSTTLGLPVNVSYALEYTVIEDLLFPAAARAWMQLPDRMEARIASREGDLITLSLTRADGRAGRTIVLNSRYNYRIEEVRTQTSAEEPLLIIKAKEWQEKTTDRGIAIWIPVAIDTELYTVENKILDRPVSVQEFRLKNIAFGEHFPDEQFVLNFPHGTRVNDSILGITYHQGQGLGPEESISELANALSPMMSASNGDEIAPGPADAPTPQGQEHETRPSAQRDASVLTNYMAYSIGALVLVFTVAALAWLRKKKV